MNTGFGFEPCLRLGFEPSVHAGADWALWLLAIAGAFGVGGFLPLSRPAPSVIGWDDESAY